MNSPFSNSPSADTSGSISSDASAYSSFDPVHPIRPSPPKRSRRVAHLPAVTPDALDLHPSMFVPGTMRCLYFGRDHQECYPGYFFCKQCANLEIAVFGDTTGWIDMESVRFKCGAAHDSRPLFFVPHPLHCQSC